MYVGSLLEAIHDWLSTSVLPIFNAFMTYIQKNVDLFSVFSFASSDED